MEDSGIRRQYENEVQEIDLIELATVIWHRIWLVILGLVLGAVLFYEGTKLLITPQYEATSTIYIFSKTTSITSLADLQLGSQLAEDFEIIATTRDVVERVIKDLELDTTYEEIIKQITVTNPQSSHMLKITVKDPDPKTAADISNALSDELREQIADIMNTDKPSTVQRAVVPTKQASPNVLKNTVIGAALGVVIVAGILIVRHLMDDTIKTSDDVRKYLNVDTLAEVPYVKSQARPAEKKKRRSKRGDR